MTNLPVFSPLVTFLILYGIVVARYVLFSGAFYLACNWIFSDGQRLITKNPVTRPREEAVYSLIACAFFALAGTLVILCFHQGSTRIYVDPEKYGYAYLGISFLILVLVHETYFYWTHRWMHLPRVFRLVHRVHHLSRHPTAWASFSFHPLEAAIEAAIIPALIFLIPVHFSVLGLFLLFMTALGTINHLGFELYPKSFAHHPFFRWWISATHHQMHHELVNCNFGLYFNFWDRWMGSQNVDYEKRFTEIFQRKEFPQQELSEVDYELLIVGGGLSGGLTAYHLRQSRPDLKFLLLEQENQLGGNHTWSFHGSDLSAYSFRWIKPLISSSWSMQEVRFPKFHRILKTSYHSIASKAFHHKLIDTLGDRICLNAKVESIEEDRIRLTDGRQIRSRVVLDARGAQGLRCALAYQKFFGLEIELEESHGLQHPVLMDVTIPQKDGFRFFYLLPWSDREILIEDTRYSENSWVDEKEFTEEILAYAKSKGWKVRKILRSERGALGIPLTKPQGNSASLGAKGAFFHDTTGYSLPFVVRMAEKIASMPEFNKVELQKTLLKCGRQNKWQRRFLRALNRMLFLAAKPQERYRVLERFYRLPLPTIERFYRGELTLIDQIRILVGRPPVPPWKGLKALINRRGIA